MTKYTKFKHKVIVNSYDEQEHYIVALTENEESEIKIAKIPSYIRYPKAVSTAIVEGLTKNSKLVLVDLV